MIRNFSIMSCLAAFVAMNGLLLSTCRGDDDDSPGAAKPAQKQKPAHDPAASAFAIPYGTVLDEKQQAEYDRLKSDKESDLRAAYAAVEQAQTPADKAAARKQLADLRAEVRAAMRKILSMPQREKQAEQSAGTNAPNATNGNGANAPVGGYSYPGTYNGSGYAGGAGWNPWAWNPYPGNWYGDGSWRYRQNGTINQPSNGKVLNQPINGKVLNQPVGGGTSTNGSTAKTAPHPAPQHSSSSSHH